MAQYFTDFGGAVGSGVPSGWGEEVRPGRTLWHVVADAGALYGGQVLHADPQIPGDGLIRSSVIFWTEIGHLPTGQMIDVVMRFKANLAPTPVGESPAIVIEKTTGTNPVRVLLVKPGAEADAKLNISRKNADVHNAVSPTGSVSGASGVVYSRPASNGVWHGVRMRKLADGARQARFWPWNDSLVDGGEPTSWHIDAASDGQADYEGYIGTGWVQGSSPQPDFYIDFVGVGVGEEAPIEPIQPPTTPEVLTPELGEVVAGSAVVTWTESTDPDGVGVVGYEGEWREEGGGWASLFTSQEVLSYTWSLPAGYGGRYLQVRVKAEDAQGDFSDWGEGPLFRVYAWDSCAVPTTLSWTGCAAVVEASWAAAARPSASTWDNTSFTN